MRGAVGGVGAGVVVIVVIGRAGSRAWLVDGAAGVCAGLFVGEAETGIVGSEESLGYRTILITEVTRPVVSVLGDNEGIGDAGSFPRFVPPSAEVDPPKRLKIRFVMLEVGGTVVVHGHALQVPDVVKEGAKLCFIKDLDAYVEWDVEVSGVNLEVQRGDGGVQVNESSEEQVEDVSPPDGFG